MYQAECHKKYRYPFRGESRWIKMTVTLSHIVDTHCFGVVVIFEGLYSDLRFLGQRKLA